MKKLYKLVTLLMIFGLFTACSSSDNNDIPATITITKTDYTVGAEQNSEVIATFTINVGWTTSAISYVGDSKDWLTVTSSGKAGVDQTITMKAVENATGVERKASFNINYGKKQQELTITQLAKSVEPTITISTSEFTVGGETGSEAIATFDVNVDWETSVISYVGDSKDWLTIAPIEGKAGTDQTITMKAAENSAGIERKASFNINYGGKQQKLTVTQGINEATDITAHFDAKFAAKLQEKGYIPDATKILFSEVRNITKIDIEETTKLGDITSLAGIEYFEALTDLNFTANIVSSLDLSKNTALTKLTCEMNQLTSLDLSKNTKLTYLNCKNNKISYLDISNSPAIQHMYIGKNKLQGLDLSNNTALEEFSCETNQLITLDVSKNTKLMYLNCFSNKLTTLVLGAALEAVNCYANELTTLDLSNSPALKSVLCFANQLTSLNLTKNTALTGLSCGSNQLSSLDLTKNIALDHLSCGNNKLTTLDVSKNTALTQLFCYENKITALNLSNNTALIHLDFKENKITSVDVTKNKSLTELDCSDNQLPSLDISMNKALYKFGCHNNPGVETTFVVKASFDNTGIPNNFTKDSWVFDGKTIAIDYQKVN